MEPGAPAVISCQIWSSFGRQTVHPLRSSKEPPKEWVRSPSWISCICIRVCRRVPVLEGRRSVLCLWIAVSSEGPEESACGCQCFLNCFLCHFSHQLSPPADSIAVTPVEWLPTVCLGMVHHPSALNMESYHSQGKEAQGELCGVGALKCLQRLDDQVLIPVVRRTMYLLKELVQFFFIFPSGFWTRCWALLGAGLGRVLIPHRLFPTLFCLPLCFA